MASRAAICRVITSLLFISFSLADEVKLNVKGMTHVGMTDDNFICATLDWWPENKCDYNMCPWGKAGILDLCLFRTCKTRFLPMPSKDGITILLINMSNSTTFEVSVVDDLNLYPDMPSDVGVASQREEYHLTPKDGDIQSDILLLNGTPLKLTEDSDIPVLNPQLVDPWLPITVGPDSIVFVALKAYQAPACYDT